MIKAVRGLTIYQVATPESLKSNKYKLLGRFQADCMEDVYEYVTKSGSYTYSLDEKGNPDLVIRYIPVYCLEREKES